MNAIGTLNVTGQRGVPLSDQLHMDLVKMERKAQNLSTQAKAERQALISVPCMRVNYTLTLLYYAVSVCFYLVFQCNHSVYRVFSRSLIVR